MTQVGSTRDTYALVAGARYAAMNGIVDINEDGDRLVVAITLSLIETHDDKDTAAMWDYGLHRPCMHYH